jgi:hypothetical protein
MAWLVCFPPGVCEEYRIRVVKAKLPWANRKSRITLSSIYSFFVFRLVFIVPWLTVSRFRYLSTIVMMPSPHVSPSPHPPAPRRTISQTRLLLSKPYARDEFRLRRRRHHQTLYDGSGPRKPKLRVGSALSTSGGDNNGTAADLYRRSLRDREKLAMAAAMDPRYVQEWGFFIKCYAEGRFNLSNPSDPPPRAKLDRSELGSKAELVRPVLTCLIAFLWLGCSVFECESAMCLLIALNFAEPFHDISPFQHRYHF